MMVTTCGSLKMRVKDKVERVLSVNTQARDNDKLLMLQVWEIEGFYLTENQKKAFMKSSSPESIRRMRQKMQEEGKYRASEAVEEKRYQMYTETKEAINTSQAIPWL